MHVQTCSHDEATNHRLPIAVVFWIIQIVSVEECLSLMLNLMQISCSTCSVILNVVATQYTCSLNSVHCPHWLVQWSHHCSHMHIPVHSPWLPGYIDVTQTVLIISTMAGLFLDRPYVLPLVIKIFSLTNVFSVHYILLIMNSVPFQWYGGWLLIKGKKKSITWYFQKLLTFHRCE